MSETHLARFYPRRVYAVVTQTHVLIFLISCVLVLAFVPWVAQTWDPQGDEPHYLLAAHSLAFDGDLDLANNYAQGDYTRFVKGQVDRHVRIGVDGRTYLSHDPGLAILIAPAYALGGRTGVLIGLALVAALIATNVYLLAYEVSGQQEAALVVWLLLSLTPLLSVYAYLVYPEMPAALLVVWSMRQILTRASQPEFVRLGGVALAIAALPWLSARFIPIAGFIAVLGAWRWRDGWRATIMLIGVVGISLAGYLLANAWMSGGGSTPLDFKGGALAQGLGGFTFEKLLRGLSGWWLDQQRGLLIFAPVYIVALWGVPLLWRRRRWHGVVWLMPFVIAFGTMVVWGGFWIAWEVSARYVVVGLPLFAAPMALAWMHLRAQRLHLRSLTFYGIITITFIVSVLNTMLILRIPGDAAYRGSVVQNYDRRLPFDLWRLLPALGGAARIDSEPATRTIEGDLSDLTVGDYTLEFQARMVDATPLDVPLLTIDIVAGRDIYLLRAEIGAKDIGSDGSYRSFSLPFENPFYDKWTYPKVIEVSIHPAADVSLTPLTVTPNAERLWRTLGAWVALLVLTVIMFNRMHEVRV